jgi:hypothetical protein
MWVVVLLVGMIIQATVSLRLAMPLYGSNVLEYLQMIG